ncbi:phosphotransferase, partial [Candidatus Micrarchaeota archaeon]|nr:phosphotransferase [Candidatus Micrarchaeota archaeon]
MTIDILLLANKIMKKFGFRSVEYFGPSKNYVFQCFDDKDKRYVFKMFHIHENRKEEDLKKAWREIAFHHYARNKLKLPEMLACEYAQGELGVYLLTEYKSMKSLHPKDVTPELIDQVIEKMTWLHEIRLSSLNPGLRARIEEEELKKNEWIIEEAKLLESNGILKQEIARKIVRLCGKVRDNQLIAKAKKVLAHGDMRIQNFYIDDNSRLQIRDFEHSNANSPLLDAASFYYSIFDFPHREDFKEKCWKALEKECNCTRKEFDEAFAYFVVHRA